MKNKNVESNWKLIYSWLCIEYNIFANTLYLICILVGIRSPNKHYRYNQSYVEAGSWGLV